jgi:hypothetical protein
MIKRHISEGVQEVANDRYEVFVNYQENEESPQERIYFDRCDSIDDEKFNSGGKYAKYFE